MAALATAPLAGAGAVAQTSTGRQAPHAELRPEAERLKLHYAQPASESKVLYEGLPIGNGHLGALVGGDPGRDFLYLCESTMWEGGRNDTLQDDGQFSYDA